MVKLLKIFSSTKKALRLKLVIQHQGLKVYQVCSDDDTRMTFDFLRYDQICVLVAVAVLEECCMAFADTQ